MARYTPDKLDPHIHKNHSAHQKHLIGVPALSCSWTIHKHTTWASTLTAKVIASTHAYCPEIRKATDISKHPHNINQMDGYTPSNAWLNSSHAVSRLRQLFTGLSSWRPRFDPRSVHMQLVVDEVAVGHAFHQVPQSSHDHHSSNAPYSFIYHWCYIILATDIVLK